MRNPDPINFLRIKKNLKGVKILFNWTKKKGICLTREQSHFLFLFRNTKFLSWVRNIFWVIVQEKKKSYGSGCETLTPVYLYFESCNWRQKASAGSHTYKEKVHFYLIRTCYLLDGNSEIGAQITNNLCYLKGPRHFIRSRVARNWVFFSPKKT